MVKLEGLFGGVSQLRTTLWYFASLEEADISQSPLFLLSPPQFVPVMTLPMLIAEPGRKSDGVGGSGGDGIVTGGISDEGSGGGGCFHSGRGPASRSV